MAAAAGMLAWNAVSKHATAGNPREQPAHGVQGGQRLGLVQRRQVGQQLQPPPDVPGHHDRPGELRPAVHDAMAHRVNRAEAVQRLGQRRGIQRGPARGGQIGRAGHLVAGAEHPQLQAARPRVDNEDPHRGAAPAAVAGHALSAAVSAACRAMPPLPTPSP